MHVAYCSVESGLWSLLTVATVISGFDRRVHFTMNQKIDVIELNCSVVANMLLYAYYPNAQQLKVVWFIVDLLFFVAIVVEGTSVECIRRKCAHCFEL